ncbi:hypothetical protein JTB14_000141 [Gonioctena quinquepunctata]|nr:hypothetical protein JTB14_000141 [Gonioctena quinquepunctata]
MKVLILSLVFLSVALSERLDNKYLPPNNAHIDTTDYSASASFVDDLKSAKPKSQLVEQATLPVRSSEPSVPVTQYPKPNGQFQHSIPSNQYTEVFHQYSSPPVQSPNHLNKPNEQFPANSQYSEYSSISANQYSKTNGQFPSTFQEPNSFIQSSVSSNENIRPNEHLSGTSQYSGPTEHSRISSNLFYESEKESFGSFKQIESSTFSQIPSSQYSKPIGQVASPNGHSPSSANQIAIIKSSIIPNPGNGFYSYNYETENGIMAQEEGTLVNDAVNVKGGYSYTSPEGEQIIVEYTADEDGFKPTGSHVPQIPEAILKSIEINKAAEARGEYQEGLYQDENEQKYAKSGPAPQYGNNPKNASPYEAPYSSQNNGFTHQIPSSDALGQGDNFALGGAHDEASFGQKKYHHAAPSEFQQGPRAVPPHLNFGASEPAKGYATPTSQFGTIQEGKGGYQY